MEFRERLYQLRKGRGISQEELAHTVGVSRQAVQKWEAGAATPDLSNLSALADYFAVSLDYLVRGIEPEKPAAPSPQQAVIQNYYRGWRYEYRSRRTLFGLPLVHINLCDRSLCRAKGMSNSCYRELLKAGHEANIEAPEELAAVLQEFYDNVE